MIKVDWNAYFSDHSIFGFYIATNVGEGSALWGPAIFDGKLNWTTDNWIASPPWHRCYKIDEIYVQDKIAESSWREDD